MWPFKKHPPYVPFKCGTEFEYSHSQYGNLYEMASHSANCHDKVIITKGKKRMRKIVCVPTGKWWYEELPDLQQVK